MAEKSPNQVRLEDIHWLTSKDDGREYLKSLMKDAVREVLAEPAVLDTVALAILKRECNLVDPTGKTSDVVEPKTSLAKKINWMAHNDAQILNAIVEVSKKIDVTHPAIPDESTVSPIEEAK